MRVIEPPAYRAIAQKRADLIRAIESGGLRVIHATALPRAGEGVRGDRAATGGQVGTGRPAPLLAKGALQDVQAVPVSYLAPPHPPGPPAP